MGVYEEFIQYRTYSRWNEEEGRRETWDETVDRYRDFFASRVPEQLKESFITAITMFRNKQVMPSMRCVWAAGEALERENISGYNCAYTVVDKPKCFSEILYILLCGTGVGFSVERQFINQLPKVPCHFLCTQEVITFGDSKQGWAEGYDRLIKMLYHGLIPKLNYSLIRAKGERLKTFGGRASGPEPLAELCNFTIGIFKQASGSKLRSIEIFDIVCKLSSCVQVGGTRRSATICLSNLSDRRMQTAKTGEWWRTHPYRAYANISAVYEEKPTADIFMEEWLTLCKNKSGERGIINREALKSSRDDLGDSCGVNPCGEIILRDKQFCNLSEVVLRPDDSNMQIREKAYVAVIFGMLQATLTNFNFLSGTWKLNCEEERLLGVSLTGICDAPRTELFIEELHILVWQVAEEWAKALKIPMPKAITCVKPSGTVSQLVDCSSGIHPRYSEYYIRRVRVNSSDPIALMLVDAGVPWKPEVGEDEVNPTTLVFEFPKASPVDATLRDNMTALDQLELYENLKLDWCDHNPSTTIYIRDDEWLKVGSWVYGHWDIIGGLSFLPYDSGSYQLMPYEEIDFEEYQKRVNEFPEGVDFKEQLSKYETTDKTEGFQELACSGGMCEI